MKSFLQSQVSFNDWRQSFTSLQIKPKAMDFQNHQISYYWLNGNHPETIMLVHGLTASKHWWDFCLPQLAQSANVLAIDLLGMGRSDHFDSYDTTLYIESIQALIKYIGLKKIHLVTHSFGSFLGAAFISKYAHLCHSFTCIDLDLYIYNQNNYSVQTTKKLKRKVYSSKHEICSRFRLIPSGTTISNPEWFHYLATNSITKVEGGWSWSFDPNVYHQSYDFDIKLFEQSLKKYELPSLLIVGEKSELFQIDVAKSHWEQLVPHNLADFRVIKDAYHHVMLDQPHLLALNVIEFVKKNS